MYYNFYNTIIHKQEPSRGYPQPPDFCLPGLGRPLRGKGRRLTPSLTVSSRSPGRGGQVRGLRKVREAPAAGLLTGRSGSSPPRAARRPQPRPGHVSLPPPPTGRARGLAAFRELRGSASGVRGLGPEQGAWGEVPRRCFIRSRENRSEDPPGKPRLGGGLGTKPRRGSESRPQAARGSLPGGARRRAARRALAAPRAQGLQSRRRGFPGAGSALAHRLARRHRGTRLGLVARRGRAEGLVSGRAESFAH